MSYSLMVFYVSSPRTREQLLEHAQSHFEGIDEVDGEAPTKGYAPVIEASPRIDQFLKDLNDRYPTAEDVPEEVDSWQCPWAGSMDVTAGTVIIPMNSGTHNEAYDFAIALAKKHDLVCVGPDDNDLIYAPQERLIGPLNPKRWWQFWR